MPKRRGIVAFSFALRDQASEPNPCNIRLAEVVERIAISETESPIIIAQWEIARKLEKDCFSPTFIVGLRTDGTYLDSKGVWEEAKRVFNLVGIREIIPVAQPFLQLTKIKAMIRTDGYTVVNRKIGYIGFDSNPKNTQPWTRGPIRLIMYALKQMFSGK